MQVVTWAQPDRGDPGHTSRTLRCLVEWQGVNIKSTLVWMETELDNNGTHILVIVVAAQLNKVKLHEC